MTDTIPASDLHPDVLMLAQKISDLANDLVLQVETLDANNWLNLANQIDATNSQLQDLLVVAPPKQSTKKTSS